MLAELFKLIGDQAVLANGSHLTPLPNEPKHVYYLDGEYCQADPQPRGAKAADLTAVVAFASEHQHSSEIWFSRERVTVHLDRETRRDVVTLPLVLNDQLLTLAKLSRQNVAHSQKEFVRLLRIDLAGCPPEDLLPLVRSLRFRQNAATSGTIEHGRASLGKAVECQLEGRSTIPDRITLTAPVFEGFQRHLRYTVECAIEIDAETEKFYLIPFPGEIESVIRRAEDDIGEQIQRLLGSVPVPVMYGTAG